MNNSLNSLGYQRSYCSNCKKFFTDSSYTPEIYTIDDRVITVAEEKRRSRKLSQKTKVIDI